MEDEYEIEPVRNWLWIEPDTTTVSAGGIHLPESSRDAAKITLGTVRKAGPGAVNDDTGELVRKCFAEPGDRVFYFLYRANLVVHRGKEYVCIEDTHLMGKLVPKRPPA